MSDTLPLDRSELPLEPPSVPVTLRAPGLVGQVTFEGRRTRGEVRSADEPSGLDDVLAEAGLEDRYTVVIDAETPPAPPAADIRRGGEGELRADEVELTAVSGPDEVQFVFYQDEDGVVTFHFNQPPAATAAGPTRRAAAGEVVNRYRIPLRPVVGRAGATGTRGWAGRLGTKVMKVLVRKLAAPLVGAAAHGAVSLWERSARDFEGFHGGGLEALLAERPTPFDRWGDLAEKRSLLFIHGTSSTTAGAFGGWAAFPDVARRLYDEYEQRVIGFNHHTLGRSVLDNVLNFHRALPAGRYEFDIVCHSRGGLVARSLKELSPAAVGELGGEPGWRPRAEVRIRRVVFVATPNQGTALASPDNIPHVLDRLASIVNLLPDSATTIALGAVLSWVAYVGEAGLKALPGLRDQAPGSQLLRALGGADAEAAIGEYHALQSNYEPPRALLKVLLDGTVDRLFGNDANDLVVPSLGVSRIGGGQVPSPRVEFFGSPVRGEVAHTRFFRQAKTWARIESALA